MNVLLRLFLPLVLALATTASSADATLFVQEPYGLFGAINPTGHTAVHLSRICAETPVRLRRCRAGELGVVISRYRKISGYDWIAIPLVPYLYAVDDIASIPEAANAETVAFLRDDYRRIHLREIVPDGPGGKVPKGSWVELVGAAYNRKIYGFQIETTESQDDYVVSVLNSHRNKSHFNLFFHNCADFSLQILNLYYPGAIRRSYIADAGITTPQQIARRLVSYVKHHPGMLLDSFFFPQIPGSRRPSHRVDGVAGGLVRSKKYILPLVAFHPWLAGSIVAVYLAKGRFNLPKYATKEYGPNDLLTIQQSPHPAGYEVARIE